MWLKVGDHLWMLVTEYGDIFWILVLVTYVTIHEKWILWLKWPNLSRCSSHQHISSPTAVTNIVFLTKMKSFERLKFSWYRKSRTEFRISWSCYERKNLFRRVFGDLGFRIVKFWKFHGSYDSCDMNATHLCKTWQSSKSSFQRSRPKSDCNSGFWCFVNVSSRC